MKKLITLLLAVPLFIMAHAQGPSIALQVVSSGGGYTVSTAANRSLSWTVGQPIFTTVTTSSHILTQGFHQGDLLDTPTYTILGKVKNAQGYLSGVEVNLSGDIVATASDGSFAFEDLEEGAYTLSINHDGYHFYTTTISTDDAIEGVIELADIVLTPITYTVQGKVRNAGGYLSGVVVKLGSLTTTSASGGAFSFTNLAEGTYSLTINHPGYEPYTASVNTNDAVNEVLNLGDITLVALTYTVQGKVRNAGGYLSGVVVKLGSLTTTSASGGAFSFANLAGGTYSLTINHPGYEPYTASVNTNDAVNEVLNLGDITLVALTYTVQGKVRNAGGYLSGVEVKLGSLTTTTASGGAFSFANVAGGIHTLSIDHDGYESYSTSVNTASAVSGIVNVGDITLVEVEPDTYTVKGKVKDMNGYLSGVQVKLGANTYTTGTTGAFVFSNLQEGSYTITINHDGYVAYSNTISTDDAIDGEVDMGDITLVALTYTVQGKVKDADGYLVGVEVIMGSMSATTTTGGVFSFANISGGTYTLTINHDGYLPYSAEVNTANAVQGVVDLGDITLTAQEPDTFTVQGKVKDADGYLVGVEVIMGSMSATTTTGGVFSFANISGGIYTLSINHDGYLPYSAEVNTANAIQGVVDLGDITLTAQEPDTYVVMGKVKDTQGYLAGVEVKLDSKTTTTDATGAFTFIEIEEGVYTLTINHIGYLLYTDQVNTNEAVGGVLDLGDILLTPTDVSSQSFFMISIYPNPFGDNLYISNPQLVEKVIITNILGQKVVDVMLHGDPAVNTEELGAGVYLITLQGFGNEIMVRRIVKRY